MSDEKEEEGKIRPVIRHCTGGKWKASIVNGQMGGWIDYDG